MRNFFDAPADIVQQIFVNTHSYQQTKVQLQQVQFICQKEGNSQKKNDQSASLFYISQYLSLQDQQIYEQGKGEDLFYKEIQKSSIIVPTQNLPPGPFIKMKQKQKSYNSPFHNYQKHLNNYLKKLIVVPSFRYSDEEFKIVARDIWKIFLNAKLKTKLILHLVFSQGDSKIINEETLRKFGFFDLYQKHDEAVINWAKNYLSKIAFDQINQVNLEGYLKTTKIQNTDGLVDYIINFKWELEKGHLKRRIQMNGLQF